MKLNTHRLLALAVAVAAAGSNLGSVSGTPSPSPAPLSKMAQVCASGLSSSADGSASAQAALAAAEGQQTMIKGMLLGTKTTANCKLCKMLLEGKLQQQSELQNYGQVGLELRRLDVVCVRPLTFTPCSPVAYRLLALLAPPACHLLAPPLLPHPPPPPHPQPPGHDSIRGPGHRVWSSDLSGPPVLHARTVLLFWAVLQGGKTC